MGALIDIRIESTWTDCCVCGLAFGSSVLIYRRRDGKMFYCPNGHGQSWTETEAMKIQKELDQERRRTAIERQMRINAEQRVLCAEKKLKRVDRGVCPECNRTFANVARHMNCKQKELQ